MSLSFRSLALLSVGSPSFLRFARVGFAGFLMFTAGLLLAGRAGAQSPPEPHCVNAETGAPCGSGSSSASGESAEDRQARREAEAEARADRKAESDRQKAIRNAQKLADKQRKDEAKRQAEQEKENQRLAAIEAQRRQEELQRQQAAEVERQRLLALEAERLQAAFNQQKPGMVSDLKGVDGVPIGAKDDSLGLKGPDEDQRTNSQAAWAATITDPQAAVYAHRLASFVPPMPISEKEVSLNCKMIYMNGNKVLKDTDYAITALQVAGVLGEFNVAGKILMMSTKTFIAGENGAYMYLVRRDKDFDAAAAFLKNPDQAQTFAHLVDDLRKNRPLPPSANPAMVQAARAIIDPRLGNNNWGIAWDAMSSPEAVSAMLRQAWIEAASELANTGVGAMNNGVFASQAERKAMFDSLRLERKQVRTLMEAKDTGDELRAQLTSVVRRIDKDSADIWKMDNFGKRLITGAASVPIADATDKMATILMGKEAKGDEY